MLSKLNPKQYEAASSLKGPHLVLAGAGSGKTGVLTHRIAHLIESGNALPGEIFAVTFTNKAAREMKERVAKLLTPHGIPSDELWITTFHASGAKILRQHGHLIGVPPHFTIFDDSDQQSLMKECMRNLDISDKLISPKAALYRVEQLKNDGVDPKTYQPAAAGWRDKKLLPLLAHYQKRLEEHDALDFGDLLLKTYFLFRDCPDVLNEFQDRYLYLLVDEYQDTNAVQYKFLKLLASKYRNLFVVGDEDQSIYKWRGADIRNILDFELDFPEAKVIKLEQNYRSSGHIIRAASNVISNNRNRKEKTLFTENPDGDFVEIHHLDGDSDEARFVARKVQDSLSKGASLDDIAVFYRTHAQSRLFEDAFRYSQIPYQIYGGMKFYDRAEIKDMLAYLRVLCNPKDDISLARIINVPSRGIGKTTIESLFDFASNEKISFLESVTRAAGGEGPNLNSGTRTKLKNFLSLYSLMANEMSQLCLSEFYPRLLELSGYQSSLKEQEDTEAEARLENLKELASAIKDFEERQGPNSSAPAFLEEISLISAVDKEKDLGPSLSMMTIHSAKGLEYDYVFLVGLEEGLFPSNRRDSSESDPEDDIEEERRLCYVGMTRAKKQLWLSSAQRRRVFGTTQIRSPSRFLGEIPESECRVFDHASQEAARISRWRSGVYDSDDFNQEAQTRGWSGGFESQIVPTDDSPYQVGARVTHPHYGSGEVVKKEGLRDDAKIAVHFKGIGVKKFVVKYAPLSLE